MVVVVDDAWLVCGERALPDAPRMVVVVVAGRRGGVGMGAPCRTRLGWWWWWMMPCAVVVWAWARPAGRASDGGGGDGRRPWWCGRERALPDAPRMVVVVVMAVRRGGVGVGAPCRTRLGWWWW
ncbi:hypothetical protein [Candidatus Amarobacter glycogenicus]|uniref:hypothetical protein n=1 Tax=Candidatus Amarobacter glycogenicus TaxID=3140699 RepID=UPI003136107A|nr:hypothetical protein [Dehalococcoidia bacterium]